MHPGMGEYFTSYNGMAGGIPQEDNVLPRYRAVSGCGCGRSLGQAASDQYTTMTAGHVALAAAGGILAGMAFTYIWFRTKYGPAQ